MGNDWRMAVTDEKNQTLITDGMYRHIRHPIYAFSMLLMLCTMVIVPTLPMLAFGAIQIGLWLLKARNEERHLLASHGEVYARYLASTGRFVPRLR
jgi:protein-S-isoprenylcysteine O-methyltransferase Ste14